MMLYIGRGFHYDVTYREGVTSGKGLDYDVISGEGFHCMTFYFRGFSYNVLD